MIHTRQISRGLLVVMSAAVLTLGGCVSQQTYEDPLAVMKHSDESAKRLAAAKQAQRSLGQDPAHVAALHEMLWTPGRAVEEHRHAIDLLIAYDEQDFKKVLSRRLVMISNPVTIEYLMQQAVERNWKDLSPAIVRSLSRPVPSNLPGPRSEEAALLKLHPGKTLEQIVFDTFANLDSTASINEQTAAWHLLRRLTDAQTLMKLLALAPERTPLVVDLKAAAADLKAVPAGREGVLRLSYMRDPSRKAAWDEAAARVARLSDEQRLGLELRHMPVLTQIDLDAYITRSRAQMVQMVGKLLDKQDHQLRGPTYDGPMRDYPQDFGLAAKDLSWADLVTIHQIFLAMQSPAVRQELFSQADRDRLDTSTEYGGVILFDAGQYAAKGFAPMTRQTDYKFIPSSAMIETLYSSLVHYHFHAQAHRNRDYAGPGLGDMRLSKNLETHCIVLTFINADTLNVDFYQPDGLVVDICSIKR